MKIKSKDIAEALGVSTATVSLAINDRAGVNKRTKKEILDYIERVKRGEIRLSGEPVVRSVALVLVMDAAYSDDSNLFFQTFYNEIFKVFSDADYSIEVIYFERTEGDFRELAERIRGKQVDGIFLWAYRMKNEDFAELEDCGIPMVIYDHMYQCANADNVLYNNRVGVEEILTYLTSRGHSRIAYIASDEDTFNFQKRREAFRKYCGRKELKDTEIYNFGLTICEIAENVAAFFQRKENIPTAVLAENYQVSLGCIQAFRELNMQVPEDISMVAFDELPDISYCEFDLATIKIRHREKAELAAKRLIDRIENKIDLDLEIYVRAELYKGNSVKDIS